MLRHNTRSNSSGDPRPPKMSDPTNKNATVQDPPDERAIQLVRDIRTGLACLRVGKALTEKEKNAILVVLYAFLSNSFIVKRLTLYDEYLRRIPSFTQEEKERNRARFDIVTAEFIEMRERCWLLSNGGPRTKGMGSRPPKNMVNSNTAHGLLAQVQINLATIFEVCRSIENDLWKIGACCGYHTLYLRLNISSFHSHLMRQIYHSEAFREVFFSLRLDHVSEIMLGPKLSEESVPDAKASTDASPKLTSAVTEEEVQCLVCWDDGEAPEWDVTMAIEDLDEDGVPCETRELMPDTDDDGNDASTLARLIHVPCCTATFHPNCLHRATMFLKGTCSHCRQPFGNDVKHELHSKRKLDASIAHLERCTTAS